MSYNRILLYFASGTGNSYRAATWIQDSAARRGTDARVIHLSNAQPREEIPDDGDTLVGILTPTHGFIAIWQVLRFVWRLPRRRRAHAFCLATRAGLKFGPVFTPGISGSGTFIIALILALKGYSVRGVMSLDMPSNWIAFHPGLHPRSAEAIIRRAEPRPRAFAERLLSGGRIWFTLNNLYEAVWGVLLLPISLLYLLVGRFFLAKVFFANNDCNGCGACARQCPVGAIRMLGARPFWKYNCESCMRCMAFCPQRAIEASHSWAVLLYFLTTVPVSMYLFAWLGGKAHPIHSPWLARAVNILWMYLSLFASYYVLDLLTRIPHINYLFTHTTLTRIYRRYHEPATSVKDLSGK